MKTNHFDIKQSGLLVHGIDYSGSPDDQGEKQREWAITHLKQILEGNWPLGSTEMCDYGYGVCFNLTGVRLEEGNRIGFEEEADNSLYARNTNGWYNCPYIFLNDILKKIAPNFVQQLVLNSKSRGPNFSQTPFDVWNGFHRVNAYWVPIEEWKDFPEVPFGEDPRPEFLLERKEDGGPYGLKDITIYRGGLADDDVEKEQIKSRVLSPKRINAIVVPRKIGIDPESTSRGDLVRRPQEYFLEELVKVRDHVGETAKNIPVYDDSGKRLL